MRSKYGPTPGLALDLSTTNDKGERWYFDKKEKRDEAERLLDEERPLLLIGSPMCTAFSRLLAISAAKRDPADIKRQWDKAIVHLEFCCRLYRKQV